MTMPTVRRSASSEAREPLLPMSHNVTESIEPEVSRAADKFALVAKRAFLPHWVQQHRPFLAAQ